MEKTLIQVLLIEDNPADALLLRESLHNDALADYRVTVVELLEQGLAELDHHQYDILLLDLGLPDSQGLETFEKAYASFPEIPVIVLSGMADEVVALQAVQSGAQDYLVKGESSWNIGGRAIRYAIERHQSQRAVRASEARFATFFHFSPAAIAITRIRDSKILEVNEAWAIMTGYASADAIGQSIGDLNLWVNPNDREQLVPELRRNGVVNGLEIQMRRRSGEIADLLFSAKLIDLAGETCMLSMALNITERKRAEAKLRESEARYRLISENAADVIWVLDPVAGRFTYVSPSVEKLRGFTPAEIMAQPFIEALTPESLKEVNESMATRLPAFIEKSFGTKSYVNEIDQPCKDGSIVHTEVTTTYIFDQSGQVEIIGVSRDISGRKQSEEALKDSEQKFRTFIEQSSDGLAIFDEQGSVIEWNQAMEQINGLSRAEALGLTMWDIQYLFIIPENRSSASLDVQRERLQTTLQTGESPYFVRPHDAVIHARSGERKIIQQTSFPIKTEKGYRVGAIVRDITELKRAEDALHKRETELSSIFRAAPVGIGTTINRVIQEVNSTICQMTGYARDELVGKNSRMLYLNDEDYESVGREKYRQIAEHGIGTMETRWKRKNSAIIDILLSSAQLDPSDLTRGFTFTALEITQRKRAERLLTAFNHSAEAMTSASTPDEVFLAASSHLKTVGLDFIILPLNESGDRYITRYLNIVPELLPKLEKLTGIKYQDFSFPVDALEIFQQVRRENYAQLVKDSEPLVRKVLPSPLKALAPWIVKTLNQPKYIAAPMKVDDMFVGIFAVQSIDLIEEDIPAITAFAHHIAIALRKAELFQQAQNEIAERKLAEKVIRLNEMKFKTLFEIAPVGISVLDQEQNILDANFALQRITGLSKKDLLDGVHFQRTYLRPDGTLMTRDEFASMRALNENMPVFDIETGIVTENHDVVWTQISAAPLDMPDASLVVITQDISERKQVEQTLRQRLAELETLYESALALNQILNPQEIGQKIIDVLAEKLDWYHTNIRLYHPESNSIELLAYNVSRKITKKELLLMGDKFRTLIQHPGDGLSGWALQHGETVRCGDVTHDTRYLASIPGILSGLYVPIKANEKSIGVISIESETPNFFTTEDEHLVVTLATQAAVALENFRLIKNLQKSNEDLIHAYDQTIEGWSQALDLRDKETEGHTQRVTTLTEKLTREMGIPDSEIIHIRRGALLHDIGKMGVPDRILLKPDKLTDEEWMIMRMHPVYAYNLLLPIEFLRPSLHIPHYHHEKWDGSGYPEGLIGEQIPLEARIFAVIDVFDALTSDRPYRPGWPRDKVISHIRENSGSHFDPKVVETFLKLFGRNE